MSNISFHVSIPPGKLRRIFFNIDWGAASNFTSSVERILEEYIIK